MPSQIYLEKPESVLFHFHTCQQPFLSVFMGSCELGDNWFKIIFFFWFGFYGPSRLFHSFWAESNDRWGEKREIHEKKHMTTHKQNLACLTCDPSYARTHSSEMTSDEEH